MAISGYPRGHDVIWVTRCLGHARPISSTDTYSNRASVGAHSTTSSTRTKFGSHPGLVIRLRSGLTIGFPARESATSKN